jgi:hypothetical protein
LSPRRSPGRAWPAWTCVRRRERSEEVGLGRGRAIAGGGRRCSLAAAAPPASPTPLSALFHLSSTRSTARQRRARPTASPASPHRAGRERATRQPAPTPPPPTSSAWPCTSAGGGRCTRWTRQ